MLEKKKGVDILTVIGGIAHVSEAMRLLEKKAYANHLDRIKKIKTPDILIRIANAGAMCDPDSIYINMGTEADRQFIRDHAIEKG